MKKILCAFSFSISLVSNCLFSMWFEEDAIGEHFDQLSAYSVDKLHNAKLMGEGYSISFIEPNADEGHPALPNLHIVTRATSLTSGNHGCHVAAIAIGQPDDVFGGGIAPRARGYLFSNDASREHYSDHLLEVLEKAATKSHVINLSGALLHADDEVKKAHLAAGFTTRLRTILEEHDAVLVITVSNHYQLGVASNCKLQYLVDLCEDKALMERVVIIGDMEYLSPKTIAEQRAERENLLEKYERLISTISCEGPDQFEPFSLVDRLKKRLADASPVQGYSLLESFTVLDELLAIGNLFSQAKPLPILQGELDRKIKAAVQGKSIVAAQLPGPTNTKRKFIIFEALPEMVRLLAEEADWPVKQMQYLMGGNIDKLMSNHLQPYVHGLASKATTLLEIEQQIRRKTWELKKYPCDDFDDAGKVVSAWAGLAQEHTIILYGENILSAWAVPSPYRALPLYKVESGTSMAAPMASALLILLHEYKTTQGGIEAISYKELLKEFKSSTRPIGPPECWGLGVLDVTKCFGPIVQ